MRDDSKRELDYRRIEKVGLYIISAMFGALLSLMLFLYTEYLSIHLYFKLSIFSGRSIIYYSFILPYIVVIILLNSAGNELDCSNYTNIMSIVIVIVYLVIGDYTLTMCFSELYGFDTILIPAGVVMLITFLMVKILCKNNNVGAVVSIIMLGLSIYNHFTIVLGHGEINGVVIR